MSPRPGMMPEERREIHLFRQYPDHHPQKTDRQVPDGGHVLGAEPLPDRVDLRRIAAIVSATAALVLKLSAGFL